MSEKLDDIVSSIKFVICSNPKSFGSLFFGNFTTLESIPKFLKNSELTLEKAKQIVDDTLQSCDDGELYLEDTKSETIISSSSNKLDSIFITTCPLEFDKP